MSAGEEHKRGRSERWQVLIAALNDPYSIARRDDDLAQVAFETIELAAIEAERLVALRASQRERHRGGHCRVTLFFHDSRLLAAFRAVSALQQDRDRSWTLIRRWADAGGDAALDEEMCLSVARRLNGTFGSRLKARVLATYED